MAVSIFQSREVLITRGFHTVNIKTPKTWSSIAVSHVRDCHVWCQQHLQGEYALRPHNSGQRIMGYFQLDSDAVLFALRWG